MRVLSLALLLAGCGGGECDEAACAGVCAAKAASGQLTAFEQGLVGPLLEDVRQGVRPLGPESLGVCKGKGRECEQFLGADVGELPPGEYMLFGELRAPNAGEVDTWKARLEIDCEVTRTTPAGTTTTPQQTRREYTVRYSGPDRGYKISPMYPIDSPSRGGARACTWRVIGAHPDGDKVYQGSWSTPAADPAATPAAGEVSPPAPR